MKTLALIILFFTVKLVIGCQCFTLATINEVEFKSYDLVVKGKIMSINMTGSDQVIQIQIIQNYKGSFKDSVVTICAPLAGQFCYMNPIESEEWLIFAKGTKTNYQVPICGRSKNLTIKNPNLKKELNSDLKFLKDRKE